jgi:RHS repeat-associated protein
MNRLDNSTRRRSNVAAGNMTTIPKPSAPTSSYTLVYDAWNRLVKSFQPYEAYYYHYDGLGERIFKDIPFTNGDVDYYYNDRWQVLTESSQGTAAKVYQWHPFYIDALAVEMRSNDTHFFLQDANYNVTAAVTSATNLVDERYSYSPYGEVTFLNADFSAKGAQSSAINNVLYTGRERDPERGIQINRHRYYDAPLGRWLTRDPAGYVGTERNLYDYVSNKPVTALARPNDPRLMKTA